MFWLSLKSWSWSCTCQEYEYQDENTWHCFFFISHSLTDRKLVPPKLFNFPNWKGWKLEAKVKISRKVYRLPQKPMNLLQIKRLYWILWLNLFNAIHHFTLTGVKVLLSIYILQYSFRLLYQKCIFDIKRFLQRKHIPFETQNFTL